MLKKVLIKKGVNIVANKVNNKLINVPDRFKNRKTSGFFSYDEEDIDETFPEEEINEENENVEEPQNTNTEPNPNINNLADNTINNLKEETNDNIKNVSKKIVKKLVKRKIILKLIRMPIFWIGIGLVILLLIITIIASDYPDDGTYDSTCDFNKARITFSVCSTGEQKTVSLEEYTTGVISYYAEGHDYSDEVLKAGLVIVKTNALAYGGYRNDSKNLSLTLCRNYNEDVSEDIEELYDDVYERVYVSDDYDDVITSLDLSDTLRFNNNTLSDLDLLEGDSIVKTYKDLLEDYYDNQTVSDDLIFIGDSRTVGMSNIIKDNGYEYVAEVGKGYDWFNNTAVTSASSKMDDDKSYGIVIWLGVNDLSNYNSYYNLYESLASNKWVGHTLYVVSVTPVIENGTHFATNSAIKTFNKNMKSLINASGLTNIEFVEINVNINDSSDSPDGLHYSNKIYSKIFDQIVNATKINKKSKKGKLKIYNLADYCDQVEEKECENNYWWPIGSEEATSGNIYGGDPSTVQISSYFGYRIHPVYGTTLFHNGIDIAAGMNSNIIATKSGTVTAAGKSASAGNYILIDHGNGISSFYCHIIDGGILVTVGQTVSQGERIGLVGTTGVSTGYHLHFEIRLNGDYVNPLDYVSQSDPRPEVCDDITFTGDGKESLCLNLLNQGYDENATAAVMANVYAESAGTFNPAIVEFRCTRDYTSYTNAVDNGTKTRSIFMNDTCGYGLIQWTYYTRKAGLYDYAKEKGVSIADFVMQYEYFMKELKASTTYNILLGSGSAYDKGVYFCRNFENPAGSCYTRMDNYLNSMINYVSNGCA